MTQKHRTPAEAALHAHRWIVEDTELFDNIIKHAGRFDGKYDSNVSLAAHILNTITIGVNCFLYEAVVKGGGDLQDLEEDVLVLAAALALHDANKYVNEKYGWDADRNSEEVFEKYFEEDDFGIEAFLDGEFRDDLLYLVQRTEVGEDSRETRGSNTQFRGLERYCRLGDATASVILKEGIHGGFEYLRPKFSLDGQSQVQMLEFTTLEQPVLNDLMLGAVKQVIAGETGGGGHGVLLGSTPDAVLYLGEEIDRDELERYASDTVRELVSDFDFSCKLNWNSFDYDILAEIGIPVESKEEIIREEYRELLERGSAGVERFEHIPEEFDGYLPILAKSIYIDGQTEFDDAGAQQEYDRIREEQGSQKAKLHFIAHLIRTYPEHKGFLDALEAELRPELHADLKPGSDAISTVVDRFFHGTPMAHLGSKQGMCFLCGSLTDVKYQKGSRAIYRTQEYSRRVPPHEKYKSLCGVCNLEYALLADICERSDVSTTNNVEVAYFYFDEFLGDIRLRQERSGSLIQGETIDLGESELFVDLVGPQYYIQPFYVLDTNHRMAVIRQVMQAIQQTGMKVVVGRPFTRFEGADAVFEDEEATRPQELLGLNVVKRFADNPDSNLNRALALFKIMSMVGQNAGMSNQYLQLDRDTFHDIAHHVVVNHENETGLKDVRAYFETYHANELMQMKTVAERGIDLFGKQYDSKFKKTKIFREAIDAFLSGKSQGMDEESLLDYVESQVYAAAQREQWAGKVTTEQAASFVEAIRTYLSENDLYDLKKLSDWENALVNSYYYAYDQLLYDQ